MKTEITREDYIAIGRRISEATQWRYRALGTMEWSGSIEHERQDGVICTITGSLDIMVSISVEEWGEEASITDVVGDLYCDGRNSDGDAVETDFDLKIAMKHIRV